METKTTENVTERRGFIKRPANTTVVIRAGYSVICEIKDRPGVVLKVPLPFEEYEQAMEIEKRVYRRLGKHPNLANVVDIDEYGIYLERAEPGCLRLFYKEGGKATPEERIKWCRDVAQVLHYVHQNNIRHADLSGRNLLINLTRNILICDFSGSAIDDDRATILAETGFRHPDEKEYRPPTIRAEIHSLGSTIYEIVTGRKPFHEKTEEQEREVEKLMEEGKYPDVSKLPLGDVIAKCWKRDGFFASAADVAEEITLSSMFRS
jgi:serine/threonine protein kinase